MSNGKLAFWLIACVVVIVGLLFLGISVSGYFGILGMLAWCFLMLWIGKEPRND